MEAVKKEGVEMGEREGVWLGEQARSHSLGRGVCRSVSERTHMGGLDLPVKDFQ